LMKVMFVKPRSRNIWSAADPSLPTTLGMVINCTGGVVVGGADVGGAVVGGGPAVVGGGPAVVCTTGGVVCEVPPPLPSSSRYQNR
jgi:hypothetical protein